MKAAITTVLAVSLLVSAVNAAERPGYVFFIDLSLDRNDSVIKGEVWIDEGKAAIFDDEAEYSVKLIGMDGRMLSVFSFNITWEAHGMERDPVTGEIRDVKVIKKYSEHYIRLSYYTEAEKIEVYHKDKKIFSRDVRLLTCRINNRCEGDEDIINCPEDCKPQAVPAGILPAETPEGDGFNKTGDDKNLWTFLAATALFFALVALISMAKGKGKKRK